VNKLLDETKAAAAYESALQNVIQDKKRQRRCEILGE